MISNIKRCDALIHPQWGFREMEAQMFWRHGSTHCASESKQMKCRVTQRASGELTGTQVTASSVRIHTHTLTHTKLIRLVRPRCALTLLGVLLVHFSPYKKRKMPQIWVRLSPGLRRDGRGKATFMTVCHGWVVGKMERRKCKCSAMCLSSNDSG